MIDARERPAWPLEEARSLACLQDRLFGRIEAPQRLHRYVLLERVGSGGGGIVYAAYDPQLDRKVAIKLLRGIEDERAQLRLVREAQALAKLAHPNVVTVFDVGTYDASRSNVRDDELPGSVEPDTDVFIVMEYVDGPTLANWLREPRSQRAVLEHFVAAGRGLAAAHALGIVHRDFKPQNVVIGGDGRARVLDFGLSRVLATDLGSRTPLDDAPAAMDAANDAHQLTEHGMVMGTPAYMAPEQHLGEAVDARADQFAFCVALFEALHGRRPFVGMTVSELVRAKQQGELRAVTKRLPRRIARALVRGLAAQPEARFADLATLLAELEPRRGRAWAWIAGVIAIAVIASVWIGQLHRAALATCEAARDDWGLLWTDARRAAVADAFARAGPADAAPVHDALDAWGERWSAARTETCIAAATSSASSDVLRRRRVCLEHAFAGARTMIDLLATADQSTVQSAAEIARSLPDARGCLDDEALAREAIPPDQAAAEAVGRVAADLVGLRARILAGEDHRAVAIGRTMVDTADASGHAPTRIRARYALAWALSRTGRLREAEDELHAGWLLAEARKLDDLQIRGALDLSGVLRARGRMREADTMLDVAVAKASRAPQPPGLASDIAVQRGRAHLDAGRVELAIASFDEALAARENLFGPDHVAIAWTSLDLARAHAVAGAPDEVRRHLRRASMVLSEHPPTSDLVRAELLASEAELAMLEARPADAVAAWGTIESLCGSSALAESTLHAQANNGLVTAWLALDRPDTAHSIVADQPERCRDTLRSTHPLCIDAFDLRARVAVAQGDPRRAWVDARTAATLAEAVMAADHPRRIELDEALATISGLAEAAR